MNSRQKGARGERQWRDELRANGFEARRGQQFAGGTESPDVVCPALPFHFEVKAVEHLNIYDAIDQARADSRKQKAESRNGEGAKLPVVAHRRNFRPWLVTMTAEVFFELLRGMDWDGGRQQTTDHRLQTADHGGRGMEDSGQRAEVGSAEARPKGGPERAAP